ncbi:tail fiber assembly chaperone [Burkholderia phage Maja]|uniref:Tail fiber assembly chaperone n=1 Tax=Burkholderia phage Maja TaxID=2767571 RepID=A0A7S6R876_9CAUD|nr:tail fiber assembly chaperone [Burkholderia phage Maja]
MLTNDQLTYVVLRMYPHLKAGEDFLVASDWDDSGKVQIDDARIDSWKPSLPIPGRYQLRKVWLSVKDEYELLVSRNKAFDRIQNELRFSASHVEASIDYEDREHESEWRKYRRALRDIPTQPDFPIKIEWPERPKVKYEHFETSIPDRDGLHRLCGGAMAPGVRSSGR